MSNDLLWLLNWQYFQNTKKYDSSVVFYTLDNPGWVLDINLLNTTMQNETLSLTTIDRSESDWIQYQINDNIFNIAGGALNLIEILQFFKTWVEETSKKKNVPLINVEKNEYFYKEDLNLNYDNALAWLQNWFASRCNGVWEHQNGLDFWTTEEPGCRFNIKLDKPTRKPFSTISLNLSKTDWLLCYSEGVDDTTFEGGGSPSNLPVIVSLFQEWVEGGSTARDLVEAKIPPQEWEMVKRFHGSGDKHWNSVTKKDIFTPHVHESGIPGGVREALEWEIPKSNPTALEKKHE